MHGYAAYAKVQSVTRSHRDTEYQVLAAVTGALTRVRDGEGSLQDKIKAVLWNDKVWSTFMCDLSSPDNSLPKSLKGALLSLAIWVAKETQLVIDNNANLDGLININKQIMEGLRS